MIKQLSSKLIYSNPWMKLREDQVEFENQHTGIYGVVEKDDFTLIIPFEENSFFLIGQYRYPIKEFSWEFPQGKHEGDNKTPAIEIANSELQEEIGMKANTITEIGFLHEAPGYSTQGFYVFFATDLEKKEKIKDITEAGLEVRQVSVKEFEDMIISGEIKDSPTISAYLLLKLKKVI